MIGRITGNIVGKKESTLLINTGGLTYEVIVPFAVLKALEREKGFQGEVELVTYHYYQMDQSRGIPVLVGFQNEIEKEFFEKFITVSGVGPKAACKALVEPFSVTAAAIDRGDIPFLKGLPGIGDQKARLIIAKLQGKVGKYCLIRDEFVKNIAEHEDIKNDALTVLLQLQYKRAEAEEMLKKALERDPGIKTSEDLLNEVYKSKSGIR